MAKKETRTQVLAAGAVVLRGDTDAREVLVVHRPRYDDWSLPKGKLEDGEQLPVCAVREVREETGVQVRLGAPLGTQSYDIVTKHGDRADKIVHWWVGVPLAGDVHEADAEVDSTAWWPVEQARQELSYDNERQLLDAALDAFVGGTLVLVRHAKAIPRKRFKGKHDAKRGLTTRGKRQAQEVAPLLAAFGVRHLVSSSWVRCLNTLTPYAQLIDAPIKPAELLTESGAHGRSKGVRLYMWRLRKFAADHRDEPVAVCGHRPVLPAMFSGLGVPDRTLETGECVVMHLDADAAIESYELYVPLV